MSYKGYTKKMGESSIKYAKENLERIVLNVRKGMKANYMEKAKAKGLSLSAYIVSLIESDNVL